MNQVLSEYSNVVDVNKRNILQLSYLNKAFNIMDFVKHFLIVFIDTQNYFFLLYCWFETHPATWRIRASILW